MSDQTKKRRKFKKRYVFIPLLVIVIAGVGLAGYFGYQYHIDQTTFRCSPTTLKKASAILNNPDKQDELAAMAAGIEGSNYKTNASCVYVVAYYNATYGNSVKAQTNTDILKKIYSNSDGYSDLDDRSTYLPSDLQAQINAAKDQVTQDVQVYRTTPTLYPPEDAR